MFPIWTFHPGLQSLRLSLCSLEFVESYNYNYNYNDYYYYYYY